MISGAIGKLARLWRGDRETSRQATADNNRWREIFTALGTFGIYAEPTVYYEEAAGEARDQRLLLNSVLM